MTINVKMSADEFMEFMKWRKDKSAATEEVRKTGQEIEDLANKIFAALEECASADCVPEVKVKDQKAAVRLLRDAAEVF